MQCTALKQVLFLIVSALLLVLLMGLFLITDSSAGPLKGICLDSQSRAFRFQLPGRDSEDWEDDDWDDWDEDWGDWMDGERSSFFTRYNRVEGLAVGMKLNRDYWRRRRPQTPFLYGHWGYAFSAKEFEYQIGLEKGVFEKYRFGFGGEYHRMIDTPDHWFVPESENSLAAFFIKEDFNDFYLNEGGTGYIVQNFTKNVTLTGTYHAEKIQSVEKNTNWSLFGGKKHFRENPSIEEGELHSMSISFAVDTRNSKKRTTRGWYIQLEGEHAGDDLKGDFTYDQVWGDLRRYQPLGYYDGVDIRLRAGSGTGDLPWPKQFYLGGPSTLRAYRYKAFPNTWDEPGGNRMLLGQIEYRLGKQDLPDEFDFGILEQFYLILFADAGWVGTVDPNLDLLDGFDNLDYRDFKSDVGVALANRGGNVRFEVARRTDTGDKPFMFWVRLNRAF